MKTSNTIGLLLTFSLLLLFTALSAQNIPQGINYQAVARNVKGEVLPKHDITLRINLLANAADGKVLYREIHYAQTNEFGLFNLIIGEGNADPKIALSFEEVPWSEQEIWLDIELDTENRGNFVSINSTKLLTVPYAFHAGTADKVTSWDWNLGENEVLEKGNDIGYNGKGIPFWTIWGNKYVNDTIHWMGTQIPQDMIFKSNNIEGIRIKTDGTVDFASSIRIGEDLTVGKNVFLNTQGGGTINNGPLSVTNQSPTLLSGNLTVDNQSATLLSGTLKVDLSTDLNSSLTVHGITDLNSFLNVNNGKTTSLSGDLKVDGITDLNNDFNVNNAKPTRLSGTLNVSENATFNSRLFAKDTTNSFSTTTGAVVLTGGIGIDRNLNVGGDAKFGGETGFAGPLTVSNETPSTDFNTGALVVFGGAGIKGNLNVGSPSKFSSTLDILGKTTIDNDLTVNGITKIGDGTTSNSANSGALQVNGGIGVSEGLFVSKDITAKQNVTVTNNISAAGLIVKGSNTAASSYVASFENTANSNGISIKVNNSKPNNNNDFISFLNSSGGTVGRIEGETLADLDNSDEYKREITYLDLEIALAASDLTIATAELVQAGVELVASSSSSTGCAGLGACVTAPIPSLIVSSGANLAVAIANEVVAIANVALVTEQRIAFENIYKSNIGVTYQSGSGDYAEWLPKANPEEQFNAGDIVGLKNGLISKITLGADKVMVISYDPIVLGNAPQPSEEAYSEKVAFMGQVPVRVYGTVNKGDYILPSGRNNGIAIGVAPKDMKIEDYSKIVGVAWGAWSGNSLGIINVAVGLNTNDMAQVVSTQQQEIAALNDKLNQTQQVLAGLIPGFEDALLAETGMTVQQQRTQNTSGISIEEVHADDVIYHEITDTQLDMMFIEARRIAEASGANLTTHPFWNNFDNDSAYRSMTMNAVKEKLEKAFHTHKEINEKMGH